jgi:dimethylglycine dehydrogenase
VTSGGFSYHFGHDIAMALIRPDRAAPGTKLLVNIHNDIRDAVVVADSMYDPQNARARL